MSGWLWHSLAACLSGAIGLLAGSFVVVYADDEGAAFVMIGLAVGLLVIAFALLLREALRE